MSPAWPRSRNEGRHGGLPRLIERIYDSCLVANDKNISSCLRVICLKYLNIYAGSADSSRSNRSSSPAAVPGVPD